MSIILPSDTRMTLAEPHLRALPGFDAAPEEVVAGVEAFCAAFRAQP